MSESEITLTPEQQAAAKASGMTPEEYVEWDSIGNLNSPEARETHARLLEREDKRREDLKAAVRAKMNGGAAA